VIFRLGFASPVDAVSAKPGVPAVKRKRKAKKFLTVLVMAFTPANRLVTPIFS